MLARDYIHRFQEREKRELYQ